MMQCDIKYYRGHIEDISNTIEKIITDVILTRRDVTQNIVIPFYTFAPALMNGYGTLIGLHR